LIKREKDLKPLLERHKKENSKPETELLKTDREIKNSPELKKRKSNMSSNTTWRPSEMLRQHKKKPLTTRSSKNWLPRLDPLRKETSISKKESYNLIPT
jgi:hypothetical protein